MPRFWDPVITQVRTVLMRGPFFFLNLHSRYNFNSLHIYCIVIFRMPMGVAFRIEGSVVLID